MKSKLIKILGVIAAVAMIATAITVAPAAAISGVTATVATTASANVISNTGNYTIFATLGTALAGTSDSITINFPSAFAIAAPTATISASTGWAGTPPAFVAAVITPVWTFDNVAKTVTVTLSGLADVIGANAQVAINITAGVTNPGTAGDYVLTFKTSKETTAVAANAITIVNPPVSILPGVATVYNSAGVYMSASVSLATALGAVPAGGKITLTDGTYIDAPGGFVGNAVSCTIQGIGTDASKVILISAAPWTMTGATVVIDMVTIDGSTGGLTMTSGATGAATVSNSYLKGAAATFVTFNGAGKNTVSNCTVTVKTGVVAGAIAATAATTVTGSTFTIAGAGLGISNLLGNSVTVSGSTFNGVAATAPTQTGFGITISAGAANSIKASTFSGLAAALTVNGGTLTFDGNTVDSCGAIAPYPVTDTIDVNGTTGLTIVNNKITNSKSYIINVAAGLDNLIFVNFNQFSGNAKAALTIGNVLTSGLNVTHNYWGGVAAPANVTTVGAVVSYSNPLAVAPGASGIAAGTALDASATTGVNVINIAGATLVGSTNLGTVSPNAVALPSTVTLKGYYDIFGIGATGVVDIKFAGTTAAPIGSTDTVYFFDTAWGVWRQVNGCTVNTFGNYIEVMFTAGTATATTAAGASQPTQIQLAGLPWALVTIKAVAPGAPAQASFVPANAATGVGISNTSFAWTAIPGAAKYNFILSSDSAFATGKNIFTFTASPTTNGVVVTKALAYNTTYYWEVQSADAAGTLLSAFTTGFFTTMPAPVLVTSPTLGQTDVSINPTFTWTAVPGAVSYEFVVAQELGAVNKFDIIDYSANTPINGITAQQDFLYSTTYNWEFRSVDAAGIKSAWTVSFFTTMAEPPPAVTTPTAVTTTITPPVTPTIVVTAPTVTQTPIVITTTTAPEQTPVIPSYLLWAVIAVGAVLVIAVIVLIVRTRRIP